MKFISLLLPAGLVACGCVACPSSLACFIAASVLAISIFLVWSISAELRLLGSTLPGRWGGPG